MQLKLKRSQREGGVIGKTVIFCLDVRVEYDPTEKRNIERYRLFNETVYNSEASKRHLERVDANSDGTAIGEWKALGYALLAAMKLNISISSLEKGHHIECKSLDELLGAENAVMSACKNLKAYLETAATFDGREVLVDFADEEPKIIAHVTTPEPMLITPPPPGPLAFVEETPALDQAPGLDGLPPPMPALEALPPPAPIPEVLPPFDDRFGYGASDGPSANAPRPPDGPMVVPILPRRRPKAY